MEERTSTFLFADLAGFTAMTAAMGDEEAADLVDDFCAALRALLPEYDATEIKTIGDAMMVQVDDASQAIRLGLRLVNEVGDRHKFPTVRVGMHTGPAVERHEDWFGNTVNIAARVSGAAGGREVLLTDATRSAAGTMDGVELHERRAERFKNVEEPVRTFAAVSVSERDQSGLPIDPVCRMAVDPGRGAGSLIYESTEYHFCSLGCAQRFASSPERYVSPK